MLDCTLEELGSVNLDKCLYISVGLPSRVGIKPKLESVDRGIMRVKSDGKHYRALIARAVIF